MEDVGNHTVVARGAAPDVSPGLAPSTGDRIREWLLGVRGWLALLLFGWLLVSFAILVCSTVYWLAVWNRSPSQPAPPHTVVVRNHGYERYFTPQQFDRWHAWHTAGWRWFGVSGVACVGGSLLINSRFLLPRKAIQTSNRETGEG